MSRRLTRTTQTRTWPMLILKVLAKARPPQMSTETAGDQVSEGTKRKAEDQLLPDARDRCEQSERGDEIPLQKLLLQFLPMSEKLRPRTRGPA